MIRINETFLWWQSGFHKHDFFREKRDFYKSAFIVPQNQGFAGCLTKKIFMEVFSSKTRFNFYAAKKYKITSILLTWPNAGLIRLRNSYIVSHFVNIVLSCPFAKKERNHIALLEEMSIFVSQDWNALSHLFIIYNQCH